MVRLFRSPRDDLDHPFSRTPVGTWARDSLSMTPRRRLLIFAALLALVALPLAARAAACCESRMSCCPAGSPCSGTPVSPGCGAELSACAPVPEAPPTVPGAEAEAFAPEPLPGEILAEGSPPRRPIPPEPPRPRGSLLEGRACLHTTLLPPPLRPRQEPVL